MAKDAVINVKINTQDAKSQLRQMTKELQNLEPGSKRFQELAIQAGKLKDQIQDTNAVIKATAGSSVENLAKGLNRATQVGVAGFQAVTSAQALFGGQSEEITKQLVKLQAIAGMASAIKELGGLKDALLEIRVALTAALGPVGLVVVAVTALAGAYMLFGDQVESTEEKQKKLDEQLEKTNDSIKSQRDNLDELNKAYEADDRRVIANAKLRGDSEKELNKLELIAKKNRADRAKEEAEEAQRKVNRLSLNSKISGEQFRLEEQNAKDLRDIATNLDIELLEFRAELAEKAREQREKENEDRKKDREKQAKDDLELLLSMSKNFAENARKKAKLGVEVNNQMNLDIINQQDKFNKEAQEQERKNQEEKRKILLDELKLTFNEASVALRKYNTDAAILFAGLYDSIALTFDLVNTKWNELDLEGKVDKIAQAAGAFSNLVINSIRTVFDNEAKRESETRNAIYKNETDQLKRQLDNRLISREEFDTKIERIEKKKQAAELQAKIKQFRREKNLATTQAVMQTAVAVVEALPNYILAAANAALGAVQVGVIRSQKFQAARGGVVPQNGKSGNVDSVNAMLAPGEVVINSNSARMFPDALSQINQMGGGIALQPTLTGVVGEKPRTEVASEKDIYNFRIQADVIESQMTNSQNRIERMRRNGDFFKRK